MKQITRRKNNRKNTAGRFQQAVHRFTMEKIDEASSSIERERRMRALKFIKTY